jgi:hypothetical protein
VAIPVPSHEILGAMITPAVLISASGTLVMSTTVRLGRIVDRVRVLLTHAEELQANKHISVIDLQERHDLITSSLGFLTIRIRRLQIALTFLYSAIGLFVCTSISIGLSSSLGWWQSTLPVLLGLSGAGFLFAACFMLLREVRTAVQSTLNELNYVLKVVDRTPRLELPPGTMDLELPKSRH